MCRDRLKRLGDVVSIRLIPKVDLDVADVAGLKRERDRKTVVDPLPWYICFTSVSDTAITVSPHLDGVANQGQQPSSHDPYELCHQQFFLPVQTLSCTLAR